MAVPNIDDFNKYINQVKLRLNQSIIQMVKQRKNILVSIKDSYILKNPISIYQIKEQKFDTIFEKINLIMASRLKDGRNNINNYIDKVKVLIEKNYDKKKTNYINYLNKLEILNPLLTIKRGYSITKIDNKVVSSVKKIKKDDNLVIELSDGKISTIVDNIYKS